jgi:peptidoglycan/xylan/chitin deacetylase (PgdA/CDA1 family)
MDYDQGAPRRLGRRDLLQLGVGAVVGGVLTTQTAWAGAGEAGVDSRRAEAIGNAVATEGVRVGSGRVVWSVPTTLPMVAVTFDDGPDPRFTPRVLHALERAGVTATFNVMGHNVQTHAALLRRAVASGHEIGNHTWTHDDLALADPATVERQLVHGRAAISAVTSAPVTVFRPPRGELPGVALQTAVRLGYDVVMWSLSRGVAGIGTPQAVADHVVSTAQPGDILALHDGLGHATFKPRSAEARLLTARRDVEIAALPAMLAGLRARGLRVVTVSELLEAGAART